MIIILISFWFSTQILKYIQNSWQFSKNIPYNRSGQKSSIDLHEFTTIVANWSLNIPCKQVQANFEKSSGNKVKLIVILHFGNHLGHISLSAELIWSVPNPLGFRVYYKYLRSNLLPYKKYYQQFLSEFIIQKSFSLL